MVYVGGSEKTNVLSFFVSYSHKDKRWVQEGDFEFIPWLKNSLKKENVEFWIDPELENTSSKFKEKIANEINKSQFAILLISQNFVDSEFISEFEMPLIKEKVEKKELSIIPILVGPVLEDEPLLKWLSEYQILPGQPTPFCNCFSNGFREKKRDSCHYQDLKGGSHHGQSPISNG